MAVYLVDRDFPGIALEGLRALQQAEIATSEQFTAAGESIRYLRSTFIPGEAHCLCLFEADDEAVVAAVNDTAGLPFTRIVVALDLTPQYDHAVSIEAPRAYPVSQPDQDMRRDPRR